MSIRKFVKYLPFFVLLPLFSGCRSGPRMVAPGHASAPAALGGHARFVDVTAAAGIHFIHDRGVKGKKYMPETTGSGCAFLDFNNDGLQDILLINSGVWPDSPDSGKHVGNSRTLSHPILYKNNGDGTFSDVTVRAGLDIAMYGMGVCIADYDNDGFEDLFITCLGPNHLFHNNGKGGFSEVTAKANVSGVPFPPGGIMWKWSSACVWVDYDLDGCVDLIVGNYVKWTPAIDGWCGHQGGPKAYCPPFAYEGLPITIYHNNRNGTFSDVTKALGVAKYIGKIWGIVACDFDGDGWPDLAVSNDTVPNFLFKNRAGKGFTETGVIAGIAVGPAGSPRAGMGIDTADWKNEGRYGMLVGNFSGEGLGMFTNDATAGFVDRATSTGIYQPSLSFLTFGLFFFDFNNDGWQDAFCANGHIDELINQQDASIFYEQRPLLFENHGGTFHEVGEASGAPLNLRYVLRGCAFGDYDNDGRLDILLLPNNEKPAKLLHNEGDDQNHWIRFRTQGIQSNRDGIGAEVIVTTAGLTQRQYVKAGSGFLSQNDRRLHFGVATSATIAEAEVHWPSRRIERFSNLVTDREYLLLEGKGIHQIPARLNKTVIR